jgi:lipid-binding SYLF domain-containing protein
MCHTTSVSVFSKQAQIPVLATVLALTSTATVRAEDDQAKAVQAVADFKLAEPALTNFFAKAVAYAIFPTVGEGGFIIGAEHGKGLLYEKGKATGKVSLSVANIGAQVGGGTFSEVIFFETASALKSFKKSEYSMNAAVKAVVAASGAAVNAKYEQGVAVFTLPKSGVMVQAAAGGQKFKFEPIKK